MVARKSVKSEIMSLKTLKKKMTWQHIIISSLCMFNLKYNILGVDMCVCVHKFGMYEHSACIMYVHQKNRILCFVTLSLDVLHR